MVKSIVIVLLLSGSAMQLANGLKCYSCTENQNSQNALSALRYIQPLADTTVPACGKDMSKWNSVTCSQKNPVCSSVILTVAGQNVLTRSCSSKDADVCQTEYPGGITVAGCQTCTTDLCNGIFKDDDLPSEGECSAATIDINVNVNVQNGASGSGSGGSGSGSGSGGSGSGSGGSGSGSGGSGSGNGNGYD